MSQQTVNAVADRLSVENAARHLGLSASTLNKMRSEGRGPRYMRLGSRVFYRRQDLDAYVEAGVVETTDSRAIA
ncbi:helix-turn-helix domain-containing protein [Lysobacter sp. FW306-1B-D06B]|uniref:helix-turn-helix transcriptional regulator n=1 Tax=Lysobacter sp. FW306-1B-D06B TaxID=3140250 RepID=UPI003140855D